MKNIIIYSQEGCPYCQEIKDLLTQAGIGYESKDIDENPSDWEKVKKHTQNDYVPAVFIADKETKKGKILAPDRDFDDMSECFQKIVDYLTQ
jgi:glutaredoxin